MLAQPKKVFLRLGMLLLILSACQGPPPAPTLAGPDYPGTLTAIAQTLSVVTASFTPAAASATSSEEAVPADTEIPATTAADPPASPTPTRTELPSPTVPMVSVTVGTNCRSGPGRVYDLVGGAEVGVKFVVIGRSVSTNYWIIRLPDGRECWLWGEHAIVEGNINSLPEYAIPATPLPPLGSIAGTITDTWGNPLANVTVSAVNSAKTVTTGSDGRYRLDGLKAGQEFIAVSAPSFEAESRLVNIGPGSAATVDFVLVPIAPRSPTAPAPGTPTQFPQSVLEGAVPIDGSTAVPAITASP